MATTADIILNIIGNSQGAVKSINNVTKVVNDNSTAIKNNTKVVNDNSTTVNNITKIYNRSSNSITENTRAYNSLGLAITGVIVGLSKLGQKSSDVAREFDKNMRNVNSLAQLSEDAFTELSNNVRDLTGNKDVSEGAVGLSKALHQIVSSGFEAAEALKMTAVASKAATAGITTTETAVMALTGLQNAYNQKTLKDTQKFSDQLFKVVDKGVISFEQLATNLGSVGATASAAKVPFEQIGAAFISLTRSGINASESETAITNLLRSIIDPSKEATEVSQKLGLAWNAATLESKGLLEMIKELYTKTGGLPEVVSKLIPEARASKAALTLLKNETKDYAEAIKFMGEANGATNRALSQQTKAFDFEVKKLTQSIEELKIEFGLLINNMLSPFVGQTKTIITNLKYLDDTAKNNVIRFGGFAVAIGAVSLAVKGLIFLFTPFVSAVTLAIAKVGALVLGLKGVAIAAGASPALGLFAGILGACATVLVAIQSVRAGIEFLKMEAAQLQNQAEEGQRQKDLEKATKSLSEYNKALREGKQLNAEQYKELSRNAKLLGIIDNNKGIVKKLSNLSSGSKQASDVMSNITTPKADNTALRKKFSGLLGEDDSKKAKKEAEQYLEYQKKLSNDLAKLQLSEKDFAIRMLMEEHAERFKLAKTKQDKDKENLRFGLEYANKMKEFHKDEMDSEIKNLDESKKKRERNLKHLQAVSNLTEDEILNHQIYANKQAQAEIENALKEKVFTKEQERELITNLEDIKMQISEYEVAREKEKNKKIREEQERQAEFEKAQFEDTMNLYERIGNELQRSSISIVRDLGNAFSKFPETVKNMVQVAQGDMTALIGLANTAIDELSKSFGFFTSSIEKFNNASKRGAEGVQEFHQSFNDLIRSVPFIGEMLANLQRAFTDAVGITKSERQIAHQNALQSAIRRSATLLLEAGEETLDKKLAILDVEYQSNLENLKKQNLDTSIFAVESMNLSLEFAKRKNELINEEQKRKEDFYNTDLEKSKDTKNKIRKINEDAYQLESKNLDKLYEKRLKDKETAVNNAKEKFEAETKAINGIIEKEEELKQSREEDRKDREGQGLRFKSALEEKKKTLGADFFRRNDADSQVNPEYGFDTQKTKIEADFLSTGMTLAQKNEKLSDLALQQAIYYEDQLNKIQDPAEKLEIQKKFNEVAKDYYDLANDKEAEKLKKEKQFHQEKLSNASAELSIAQTDLEIITNEKLTREELLRVAYMDSAGIYKDSFISAVYDWSGLALSQVGLISSEVSGVFTESTSKLAQLKQDAENIKLEVAQESLRSTPVVGNSTNPSPYQNPFDVGSSSSSGGVSAGEQTALDSLLGLGMLFQPDKWFAGGGLVTSPTFAGMGENGAEMILNQRQMGNLFNMISNPSGGAGGGITVVTNFNGAINANDAGQAQNLINQVSDGIAKKLKKLYQ